MSNPSIPKFLPIHRSLTVDLLCFSRHVPLFPLEKEFQIPEVTKLRQQVNVRVSWAVLFMKAYGIVSKQYPQLRQAWMPWPWVHFYVHPTSICMLAIAKEYQGGDMLFFGRFIAPENQSLLELQQQLDTYQREPAEKAFRRQLRFAAFPGIIRRLGWRLSLNLSGARRARRLGTCGISSVAGQGVLNRYHPTLLTSSLSYGPINEAGQGLVTLICDHRVLDGQPGAAILNAIEAALNHEIANELKSMLSET